MSCVNNISSWICETTQELYDHPEQWPAKRETAAANEPYWMGLEVRSFMNNRNGEIVWCFDAFAHRGPDSQIEMSMNMASGTKEEVRDFMRDQLDKDCPKAESYRVNLWLKLTEKGDYDPRDDDWW